jgi:hypothetical protein
MQSKSSKLTEMTEQVSSLGVGAPTKEPVALDKLDQSILAALAEDGRISITDLAARIGLSKSPTQARLRRLEKTGIIMGYRALLDPISLGLDHVAFVEVRLTDTREAALLAQSTDAEHGPLSPVFGRCYFGFAACGIDVDLCGDGGGERGHVTRT